MKMNAYTCANAMRCTDNPLKSGNVIPLGENKPIISSSVTKPSISMQNFNSEKVQESSV